MLIFSKIYATMGSIVKYADVAELADAPDLGSVLYVILLLITGLSVFIYED